jgi:2-polyprenyl-3-methyl-5-hydroxy-6-metoxy-1,4-benzoquinol methylase
MNEHESPQAEGGPANASRATTLAGQCMDEQRIAAYTTVREDVASLVPDEAIRILDVGCSNGALGHALKLRREGRHVTGIEIDAGLADEARRVLDVVLHADLEAIDVAGALASLAPFDCIVCADVLEHIRDPWSFLAQLMCMLEPEGAVVVALPNVRHHSALGTIGLTGRFPRRARGIFDGTHLRWFTWTESVEMLRGVGLEVDTANYAIRIGDRGGGRINRLANRLLDPIAGTWLVREFFSYQFSIRGRRQARASH